MNGIIDARDARNTREEDRRCATYNTAVQASVVVIVAFKAITNLVIVDVSDAAGLDIVDSAKYKRNSCSSAFTRYILI